MADFSTRLRNAMENIGITPKELAEFCGISLSSVQMYVIGRRRPRDPVKVKIAAALGATVESLFF